MKITINVQDDRTEIAQGDRETIKKALKFYVETSRKVNSCPTESESYEIFDMNQLIGMMDYPIYIDISEQEKAEFSSKYGIDFPEYI